MRDDVATTTALTVLLPDGRTRDVEIRIGRPHMETDGQNAACEVYLHGLEKKPRTVFGVDTFQALAMALLYVRLQLEDRERDGWEFRFHGEPFLWRQCWFQDPLPDSGAE